MQKKIIALAIAGLASTAAFAQSNVTIYGSVDVGYSYRFDAENSVTNVAGASKSRSSIDSGQQAGNRLGFKGVEDLGNGLKAVFVLENGFSGDNGAQSQGGRLFGRQAYAGLTGGFGTVVAGRLYTPYWTLTSGTDPFAAGTVGQMRNVFQSGTSGATATADTLLDPARVDSAVAYISPSFGGFDVTAAYSNATQLGDVAAQESLNNNARNNTVYALLAKYAAGPVMVGFNVHRIAVGVAAGAAAGQSAINSVDNYTLAGTFDAKVVKLHAMAQFNQVDSKGANADFNSSNYMLGATVPVGKLSLKTSVTYSDFNGDISTTNVAAVGRGQATQYALGADYALSKRTNLYTAYSLIDAESARSTTIMGVNDASPNNGTSAAGNPFQQGFQMGVRHQF